MVKGVNKTVIEVNNTGSKIFDRIVFYVSPSCSDLNARHLKRAMQNFTFQFDERAGRGYKTIRQKRLLRRAILIGVGVTVAIALTAVLIIFV